MIQGHIVGGTYKASNELLDHMKLIVSNARLINPVNHPITKSAEDMFAKFLLELSKVTDRLLETASAPTPQPFFPCPDCHIAICTACKKIEHSGSPCDTTESDHEIAMLAQFGYKRCPRCRAGVKKMFGCSHMQCLCGAHWCYFCEKSIHECDGSCEQAEREEDEEENAYDSEEEDLEDELAAIDEANNANNTAAPAPNAAAGNAQPAASPNPAPPAPVVHRIVNLDRGGEVRWGDGAYDFGDEPEEESFTQVWSCHHSFELFRINLDGYNHGNHNRMECNRCFERVEVKKQAPKHVAVVKKRRHGNSPTTTTAAGYGGDGSQQSQSSVEDDVSDIAHECKRCKIVVCKGCRAKFINELAE
jgi:hypothetical protein